MDQSSPSAGGYFVSNDIATPINALPTVGSASGGYFAVSDQTGPGAHLLYQSFTIPTGSSLIVSFDMFVNNWFDGVFIDPSGLDWTTGGTLDPNQHARVDILSSSADPFDTGVGVLHNLYVGDDGPNLPNPYSHYAFNIIDLSPGGTFVLRFAEVDNQFLLNQGIDNVSILAVPEQGPVAFVAAIAFAACLSTALRRPKNEGSARNP